MSKTTPQVNPSTTPSSLFLTVGLDMSWRLAVVVLLPLAIGAKLDDILDYSPALTVLGLVVATIGAGLVIKRAVNKADQAVREADARKAKHAE